MNHLSRALEFALSQTWAMEEGQHRRMMQVLVRHSDGIRLSDEEIEAATGKGDPSPASSMTIEKGVATIPIHGVIAHRAASVGRISSRVGTSVEGIRADLQAALENPNVQSILLDVDSPGGSVAGIDDLAAEIRDAKKVKPIIAHTDALMASAAYWLASQANKITATRSAAVGSIGVIATFMDTHRKMANEGLDPVVVKSAPGKGGTQSNGTLSDADRADIQREVDAFHGLFVESVAAGRGIGLDEAKALGDGRVYVGTEAQARGLVDAIGSRKGAMREARQMARELAAITPAGNIAAGAHHDEEDPQMTKTIESAADLKQAANTPDMAPVPPTPKAEAPVADAPKPDAVQAERSRMVDILGLADANQQDLARSLIEKGATVADAAKELTADRRRHIAPPSSQSIGNGNSGNLPAANEASKIAAMPEGEEKWKAEFEASKDLQAEFGDVATYAGWKRNEANVAASKGKRVD